MQRIPKLLLIATLLYVIPIGLVCIHPIGRRAELSVLIAPTPQAIAVTLWMIGAATVFVVGSKDALARRGCIGSVISVIAVLLASLSGIIPDSWTRLESEMFVSNLITVAMLPCVFVFLAGLWKRRTSS